MNHKITKEAYDEALKDVEQDKKEKIKQIIKATLKKKLEIEEDIGILQKKKKILNKDLEDFQKGRLDLVEERQKVDELARKTSIVRVEKIIEHHNHYNKPWYEPYNVVWYDNSMPPSGSVTYSSSAESFGCTSVSMTSSDDNSSNVSGNDFHFYSAGTYDVGGKIFNL